MVRSSTSPALGAGSSVSSMRKSDGFGSPAGREARTTRLADCGMMVSSVLSFCRHCEERSDEAIQPLLRLLDCFVATLLAMTARLHPARIVRAFTGDGDVVDG